MSPCGLSVEFSIERLVHILSLPGQNVEVRRVGVNPPAL